MKSILIISLSLFLIACGNGNNNSGNGSSYYSASSNSYYQIESQNGTESLTLTIISTTGNSLNNVPLIPTTNGYTFSTSMAGSPITGSVVIDNDLLGIAVNGTSPSTIFADFAITPALITNNISNGTYTTVCDRANISACTIVINDNQISITKYNTSGQSKALCQNQAIQTVSNAKNPYILSFTCGVQGGSYSGIWYMVPLIINETTGIMLSEYNPNINSPDAITDEIAFPQQPFNPVGTYNYVYNGIQNNNAGIGTATFTSSSLLNSIVGSCAGAACALIQGQYAGIIGMVGNVMAGFDYYNVNNDTNYNLVGNNNMNIFMDSYSGIYF